VRLLFGKLEIGCRSDDALSKAPIPCPQPRSGARDVVSWRLQERISEEASSTSYCEYNYHSCNTLTLIKYRGLRSYKSLIVLCCVVGGLDVGKI
jgi:hypothetical protein